MYTPKTAQEAIDYILQSIKNIDPTNTEVTREDVEDLFYDLFDEKIEIASEWVLNDVDNNLLAEKIDDEAFVDNYLAQRIPHYYDLVTETVAEIMNEYMSDDDEDDNE